MTTDNYFDTDEEDVLHDAYMMIASDDTEYDTLREVLLGETVYDERALDWGERQVHE